MAFIDTTLVLTPSGENEIKNITKGDEIETRITETTWKMAKVSLAIEALANTTLHINFGDNQTIITTPKQPFLMSDNSFKRATDLTLSDLLIDKFGAPKAIHGLSTGKISGRIKNIAVPAPPKTAPIIDTAGHLILCNGVIAGDYYLEVYFDSIGG